MSICFSESTIEKKPNRNRDGNCKNHVQFAPLNRKITHETQYMKCFYLCMLWQFFTRIHLHMHRERARIHIHWLVTRWIFKRTRLPEVVFNLWSPYLYHLSVLASLRMQTTNKNRNKVNRHRTEYDRASKGTKILGACYTSNPEIDDTRLRGAEVNKNSDKQLHYRCWCYCFCFWWWCSISSIATATVL